MNTRPFLISRLKEEWNNLDPVDPLRGLLSDAIDALTEQPAQQQEPVAWMWKDGTVTTDPDRADGTWTPLYTSPPASKPLSVEKIAELDCNDHYKFARAIEAAHGIKEKRND